MSTPTVAAALDDIFVQLAAAAPAFSGTLTSTGLRNVVMGTPAATATDALFTTTITVVPTLTEEAATAATSAVTNIPTGTEYTWAFILAHQTNPW
jgi:hypothetical protein